jgi:anaerobic magnesium-protoporphyrin IX monomethyl ester cyclase
MKIGLINVNFRSEGPETLMGYMTPLHLLALGGPLIDAGFTDTALIDAQNDDLDLKETIAAILDQKFEIVFISAMAATAASPLVLSVMRGVKAINPNVYLVTGGVHASYEYETMMRDYPDLDFIGRGEGERTVCSRFSHMFGRKRRLGQSKKFGLAQKWKDYSQRESFKTS